MMSRGWFPTFLPSLLLSSSSHFPTTPLLFSHNPPHLLARSLVSNSPNTPFRFPNFLRYHVQAVLAHFWTTRLPIIQPSSPASLVARVLRIQLGATLSEYTFVDFCAGAGGPTPAIERVLNSSINRTNISPWSRNGKMVDDDDDGDDGDDDDDDRGVDFVLTDLHPHLSAWHTAARQSPHILFVPASVDASAVPQDLLSHAVRRRGQPSSLKNGPTSSHDHRTNDNSNGSITKPTTKKQFRLFSLALHHFDDAQAARILRHALRTSSGFAVFELQARTFESLGIMALFGPLIWAAGWYWFWGQLSLLFWTYVLPVVPFVVVFDGVVSSLRTRTPAELLRLIRGGGGGGEGGSGSKGGGGGLVGSVEEEEEKEDEDEINWPKWRFQHGSETHTWPLGQMSWFVGIKEED